MIECIKYGEIHYYKNVIENPYELIEQIEKTDSNCTSKTGITKWRWWKKPSENYGKTKAIKPNIKEESKKELIDINNQIVGALNITLADYLTYYPNDIEKDFRYGKGGFEPLTINKYFENAHMSYHTDSQGDKNSPTITSIIYLNDDYLGGELGFKDPEIVIKPEAGSVVVFPSMPPYYHESKLLIKGTKYMILQSWFKTGILDNFN